MTMTTTITDVRTIGVTVTNQEAALRFYTDILGFETRLDAVIGPDMRWIEVAPTGAAVSIALTHGAASGPVDTGIRFTVPNADTEHASLAARGVTVSEVLRWDDVPAMFTFDDADANRYYIVEDQS